MKITLIILFLISGSSLWAQPDTTTDVIILEYGLPLHPDYSSAQDSIDKKWGINRVHIANCSVTESFRDSVHQLNKESFDKLNKRYGDDWRGKHNNEVKNIVDRLNTINDTIFDYSVRINNDKGFTILNYNGNDNSVKVDLTNLESQLRMGSLSLSINNGSNNVNSIYRGYENKVVISIPPSVNKYQFTCTNCRIVKFLEKDTLVPNTFFISPGSGQNATLEIRTDQNHLKQYQLNVSNLPRPMIYLNNNRVSDEIELKSLTDTISLHAEYPVESGLQLDNSIENWRISSSDQRTIIYGKSDTLYRKDLVEIMGEKNIFIECDIIGVDGRLRRLKYTLEIKE